MNYNYIQNLIESNNTRELNVKNTIIQNCSFNYSTLEKWRLENCIIQDCKFNNCWLESFTIKNTTIRNTQITICDFIDVGFYNCILKNTTICSLMDVGENIRFINSSLFNSELSGIIFSPAFIERTVFSMCSFQYSLFKDLYINESKLQKNNIFELIDSFYYYRNQKIFDIEEEKTYPILLQLINQFNKNDQKEFKERMTYAKLYF